MASSQTQTAFFAETEVSVFDDEVFLITRDVMDISDDTLSVSDSLNIECFHAGIVYTYDGSEPTLPHGGHTLQAGKNVVINGNKNIANFKAISLYDSEVDDEQTLLYLSFSSNSIYGAPYNGIVNVRKPQIGAGDEYVGAISYGYPGEWTGNPTLTYQWQRSLDGEIWEDISGATEVDYLVQPRDYGYYIRFAETANGLQTRYSGSSESPVTVYYGRVEITTTGTNYVFDWYVYISDDISIAWGDETSNNYTTANDGYITHTYATAGTYTIFISDMKRISEFYVYSHSGLTIDGVFASSMINCIYMDLSYIDIQWEIGENAPIPPQTVEFYITEGENSGLIWDVNEYPIPEKLQFFRIENPFNLSMNVSNASSLFHSGFLGFEIKDTQTVYWTINQSNPIPSQFRIFGFDNCQNVKWNINDVPFPSGTTYIKVVGQNDFYWTPNSLSPIPSSVTYMQVSGDWLYWEVSSDANIPQLSNTFLLYSCPNVTFDSSFSFSPAYRTIQIENNLSQADVDLILEKAYDAFPTKTSSGGSIDLLGGGNEAASGIYQAANPPDTGLEYAYELVNDSAGVSANHFSSVSV